MKILHLGKFFRPDRGGIETATEMIVDYLWEKQIATDVLCLSTHKTGTEKMPSGSVFFCKPFLKLASASFSWRYIWKTLFSVGTYDIIHVHLPNPLAFLLLLSVRKRQKVVLHWHSDVISQKKLYYIYRPFEKLILRRSDSIVVGTSTYAENSEPLAAFQQKITIIPFCTKAPETSAHKAKSDVFHVLAIGRMVPYKGFEYLVTAAAKFDSKVRLTIIGGGPEHDKLSLIVSQRGLKNVSLLSRVDNLVPYFEKASLFCLPSISKAEAFGIVLIEAMSFGLPLLTTRVAGSGMNYINLDQETGLVVAPKSSDELANAINSLVQDREKLSRLGEAAQRRFYTHFRREVTLPKFAELYKALDNTASR